MIVWGGFFQDEYYNDVFPKTGGRYNPVTDTWIATSTTNAPDGRADHMAVWTETEMIIWGGATFGYAYNVFATGARYNPLTDSWTPTTNTNAPAARSIHTAVWTGSEMIVWGGYDGNTQVNTGGKYDPNSDTWTATGTIDAPLRTAITPQFGPAAK